MTDPVLRIEGLRTVFRTSVGEIAAVDGVDLEVPRGRTLGIVGESGCGKSMLSLSVMRLVPPPGRVAAGRVLLDGRDLLALPNAAMRDVRGSQVAMIFQEPMTSLNPCFTVGFQIMETLRVHEGLSGKALRNRAIALLEQVGIPAPETRLSAFPHQLSGGMNQRVMIAIAIACNPRLLVADEPTTALDVTIQKQILDLLVQLQRERGMALILITHDMGVVAETAQRVVVMYAGQVAETRPVHSLFERPRHPYTGALLDALPERALGKRRLPTIPGMVPGIADRPAGCLFSPRCRFADARCRAERPALFDVDDGRARCFYPLPDGHLAAGEAL